MASSSALVIPASSNSSSSSSNNKPRSFYSISILLENASSQSSTSATTTAIEIIKTYLKLNLTKLQSPENPYPRTPASKTAIESGKLDLNQKSYIITNEEKKLILEISNKFDLDEILSFISFRNVVSSSGVSKSSLNDEDWSNLTKFIFGERAAILGIVGLLLRCQDDESHPCYELAQELLPSILTSNFTLNILNSFKFRTEENLPLGIRSNSTTSITLFWTKELIREQKSLLEILFVIYYTGIIPTGEEVLLLFNVITTTNWGRNQELFGYFNIEIKVLIEDITNLLNIIAIETLNLELSTTSDFPIPTPQESPLLQTDMYHPSKLLAINQSIELLAQTDRIQSSPILIAWSFILSRIANSFTERGIPNVYQNFAGLSLGSTSTTTNNNSSSSPSQPLYQLYAAHALSPPSELFSTLLSILKSPLFGSSSSGNSNTNSEDPNLIGYISVLRSLITCLPNLIKLTYLSNEQFSALISVFNQLYSNPSAAQYCLQFWEEQSLLLSVRSDDDTMRGGEEGTIREGVDSEGEREIVNLAKSRFPVQFGNLLGILASASKGVNGLLSPGEEDEEVDLLVKKCSEIAFNWFSHLSTITSIMLPTSAITPLPYVIISAEELSLEFSTSDDNNSRTLFYKSTRPIPISRSLTIPVGTKGKLVSQQGRKPLVISWELDWSGWKLIGDVLEEFCAGGVSKKVSSTIDVFGSSVSSVKVGLPIEWNDEAEKEGDVVTILALLSTLLLQDPALGTTIVEHISSSSGSTQSTHFVEIVFKLLQQSLSSDTLSTQLITSILNLIASLLPSYPGVIWTYLRGSTLLFPSINSTSTWNPDTFKHSILQHEKLAGYYPITLSLLSLVDALVLEDQISSYAISKEFQELKSEVLVRALHWIRDEVWSNFSTSWRFNDLNQKFELSNRIIGAFKLILDEGELCPGAEKGEFDPVSGFVIDSLLVNTTSTRLAPLLSIIISSSTSISNSSTVELNESIPQISEELILNSLELVAQLLRLRRRIKGISTCLIEKLCLTEGSEVLANLSSSTNTFGGKLLEDSPSLLFNFIQFVIASSTSVSSTQETPRIAIVAAKIITLLCITSSEYIPRPPSFVALLGGTRCGKEVVGNLLIVLEDVEVDERVKGSVWDMVSSFVESQPSLAMLFVTGRAYPIHDLEKKGKGKEIEVVEKVSQAEEEARALAKTLAPAPFKPLSRTAIGVALETIGLWNEAWEETPILLAAVLRFFDFTWQHLVDFGPALDEFRSLPIAWDNIVDIAFKDLGSDPSEESEVASYCYRTMAKAHAVRILALDIQAAISRSSLPKLPISAVALFRALSNQSRLSTTLVGNKNGAGAIHTSCAPTLHQGIFGLIMESFPEVSIESLRIPSPSHPLDDTREFGPSYLYSLPHLRRKLDGFMSDSSSSIRIENLSDVIIRTSQVNLNFSKLEAQISNTRSWRQLLEISLPLLKRDSAISTTFSNVALEVAQVIANEDRVGQIMSTVHEERLSILLTMVEILPTTRSKANNTEQVSLLTNVSDIFMSIYLLPIDSVARRINPIFHPILFRIAYFLFRHLNAFSATTFDAQQLDTLAIATDHILRVMITATRDILVLARSTKSHELQQDLILAISVVNQLVSSPYVQSPTIWLSYCQAVDLFRCSFEVLVYMEQIDGKPLYAQSVLDMCLAMASATPKAAEQMALEGLMTALTNNALTASAEAGVIHVVSQDGQRTPQHELWTSMLGLVVALISALGDSTQFVEQEVVGFIRLYSAQISIAMSWNTDTTITYPGLEETSNAVALLHGLVKRGSKSSSGISAGLHEVTELYIEQALNLLQQVVYAVLHPNLLSNLVDAVSQEERAWIEKDLIGSTDTDLSRRPVLGSVTMALLQLARGIIDSLLAHTLAFSTLTKEISEWKTDRAVVVPTATVTSNEKASIGTLFDLASFCLDTLRAAPTGTASSVTLLISTPLPPYTSARMSQIAQQTLETTQVLIATQLGLWLYKPVASNRANTAMRREIVGELKGDLLSVLDKKVNKGVEGEIVKLLREFVVRNIVE